MAGWLVFGCRTAFAPEVAEAIWRRGEEVTVLVDNLPDPPPQPWAGSVPVMVPDDLSAAHLDLSTAIPQVTPGHRHAVAALAMDAGLSRFPALVDPTAAVARTADVGRGSFVGAGAVVAAMGRLGEFVVVNRSASIGHHARIDDYASLGPACTLAGGVTIGRGAFVGAGATCAPGVSVGANATVGAGAVVLRDVAPGEVVVGNPATVLRSGTAGMGGVGVP